MQVFLDDFAVYGTAANHFQHLQLCLERCRVSHLSLNPAKYAFGVTSGSLLGHIVSKEGIAVDPNKISSITQAKMPANAKALSRFLGQIRWHSRMLHCLADFAMPLHAIVHCTPFTWTIVEDKAYEALKVMLTQAPVVQPPDWANPFHVFVDASDIAIGSALMQLTEPNWYRPVYYASRKLSAAERNYSTTENEALGMIYNISKFRHYLLGRKFTFHMDHATLLYLVEKQTLTSKLARWMLLLQEFDFIDYLSRLDNGEMMEKDDDDFPDVEILRIAAIGTKEGTNFPDRWLMEMRYFLTTGLPPP